VEAASLPIGTVLDNVKAGKVRFLMVYSDKRYGDHPDVPTVGDAGFPDAAMPSFWGIYVRKDTPEPMKKVLADVSRKMWEDPDLRKGIERLGGQPRYGGPDFIRGAIKRQEEIGIPVLKELGLLVER
jgi:tripartite-type tricarboxylate transporter receptor subunit TctC